MIFNKLESKANAEFTLNNRATGRQVINKLTAFLFMYCRQNQYDTFNNFASTKPH